jgi:hypothetical protein
MYITTKVKLCNICIHAIIKFKSIPLMCTHVESYVFGMIVHPGPSDIDQLVLHQDEISLKLLRRGVASWYNSLIICVLERAVSLRFVSYIV